jgi:hypothetical protein
LALESLELLSNQINLFDNATYNINYYTSKYYSKTMAKYFDYYSDYICNETIENIETLRDDIILHENSIRNRDGRNE